MTVGELKEALNHPMLRDTHEVQIGVKISNGGCEADDDDAGILEAVVCTAPARCRVLLLIPTDDVWKKSRQHCSETIWASEEGDE